MQGKTPLKKQKDNVRHFSILLAEENRFLGQKIVEILLRDSSVLWVFHVTRKSTLLHEAAKLHPDLILSDITLLKEKQTVETLRRTTPFTRIVALTGLEAEPYAILSRRLGLDGMVEKGRVEINALKQIIQLKGEGLRNG